jgi:hypothetical protein
MTPTDLPAPDVAPYTEAPLRFAVAAWLHACRAGAWRAVNARRTSASHPSRAGAGEAARLQLVLHAREDVGVVVLHDQFSSHRAHGVTCSKKKRARPLSAVSDGSAHAPTLGLVELLRRCRRPPGPPRKSLLHAVRVTEHDVMAGPCRRDLQEHDESHSVPKIELDAAGRTPDREARPIEREPEKAHGEDLGNAANDGTTVPDERPNNQRQERDRADEHDRAHPHEGPEPAHARTKVPDS